MQAKDYTSVALLATKAISLSFCSAIAPYLFKKEGKKGKIKIAAMRKCSINTLT